MQTPINEKVNVFALFRGHTNGQSRGHSHKKIRPYKFERPNGEVHKVAVVKKAYGPRKGQYVQAHFTVQTTEDRYFDLVFDAREMTWTLLYEFDDQMILNG